MTKKVDFSKIDISNILEKYQNITKTYHYDKLTEEQYINLHIRRFFNTLFENQKECEYQDLSNIITNFDNSISVHYFGLIYNDKSKDIIDKMIQKIIIEINFNGYE